jgi:hypothetical protein
MKTRFASVFGIAALLLGGAAFAQTETIRIGIVADMHVRDTARAQLTAWSQTGPWLKEFLVRMAAWKSDFNIELGDMNDSHDSTGPGNLDRVRLGMSVWKTSKAPHYSVMGNHETARNARADVVPIKGMPGSYYSFDAKGYHFVVLDSNAEDFGATKHAVSAEQLTWLKRDLAGTKATTVVFIHCPIDTFFGDRDGADGKGRAYNQVQNEAEVRKVLEDAGNVILVVEGHAHSGKGPIPNEPKETVLNKIRYWYIPSFTASVFCYGKLTLAPNRCALEITNDPEGTNGAGEKGSIFKMQSYRFDYKR